MSSFIWYIKNTAMYANVQAKSIVTQD